MRVHPISPIVVQIASPAVIRVLSWTKKVMGMVVSEEAMFKGMVDIWKLYDGISDDVD